VIGGRVFLIVCLELRLLFGFESFADCVFAHEIGDFAAEVRLPGIEHGIHDFNAPLNELVVTM